jgi:hypothetical protein
MNLGLVQIALQAGNSVVSLHQSGHQRGKKGCACNANKETAYRVIKVGTGLIADTPVLIA